MPEPPPLAAPPSAADIPTPATVSPSLSVSTPRPSPRVIRFETPLLNSSEARTGNIRLVAQKLNGLILPAGGDFSFNREVGPRTMKKGYRKATVYVNGEKVQEIGGGICQVSTTLYNAAVSAGFEITERHEHQKQVPYAAEGKDASVYYGKLDLKFSNNTGSDYTLFCAVQNKAVVVELREKL